MESRGNMPMLIFALLQLEGIMGRLAGRVGPSGAYTYVIFKCIHLEMRHFLPTFSGQS